MFVGTSISEAFWKDFERVWGGQNPRFSLFLRYFFEANFGRHFGRVKNREKWRPCRRFTDFGASPTECAEPGGEIERG